MYSEKIKYSILIIVVLFIAGCDPTDDRLTLTNNSENEICYIISDWYPDSILQKNLAQKMNFGYNESSEAFSHSFQGKIKPYKTKRIVKMSTWHTFVSKNYNQQLVIFTFNSNYIKNLDTAQTLDSKFQYKRHSFTLDELKQADWKINLN